RRKIGLDLDIGPVRVGKDERDGALRNRSDRRLCEGKRFRPCEIQEVADEQGQTSNLLANDPDGLERVAIVYARSGEAAFEERDVQLRTVQWVANLVGEAGCKSPDRC